MATVDLIIAIVQRDTTQVQRLLEDGADVNTAIQDDRQLQRLMDIGINVYEVSRYINLRPLSVSIRHFNLELVKALLQAGADVRVDTPLHYALYEDNLCGDSAKIVEALIQAGAGVDAVDDYGLTPLHIAATSDRNGELVKTLIRCGANVNAIDLDGWTPLHSAASTNSVEAVKTLIQCGAKVNAINDVGWTPLYIAAGNRNKEVVECLIDMGARRNLIAMPNRRDSSTKDEQIRNIILTRPGPKWTPSNHATLTIEKEKRQIKTLLTLSCVSTVLRGMPNEMLFEIFDKLVQ